MANHKKLLAGLAGEGITVSVSGLARYMASQGIKVSPTIGRRRGYVSLNEKAYGLNIDDLSDNARSFYQGRVSQGHLNFIPPADEAAFASLEKRLRRAVERRTLADGFMPITAYESLRDEFQIIRADYFAKRDEVLSKWPLLISEFQIGAQDMLNDIEMPDYQRAQVMASFMSEISSVGDYRDSFKMELNVHAFPAQCDKEGLSSSVAEAVQSTWRNEVVTTAITAIETLIGSMWAKSLTAIRQYLKSGAIKANTINSLAKLVEDLSWKNVFKNPVLTQLEATMKGIANRDAETQAEIIESSILDIFVYAKDTHLDLDYDKSPYTELQLEQMAQLNAS